MNIETIKYRITLNIDNLITNKLDQITKNITRKNIELEYNTPKEIDKKHILNYFSKELKAYCTKNKVNIDNLAIDGYEIAPLRETARLGIDVYFKSEDVNTMTFEPSIMATLTVLKDMPVLFCEQLNDTTIKWYWEDNGSVNYIKDQSNNIIAEIPLNVDYYIESNLEPEKTYTRILTTTNKFDEQLASTPCIITLEKNTKVSLYNKFKVEDRNETIQTIDTNTSSKLKAFSSGVGDFDDCLLYKADDTKFSRKFKLLNKIYGVRASGDIKHHTIKFKYRYKLIGKVDYISYNAKFTVKVTATQCVDLKYDPDKTLFGTPMVCERDLTFTIDDNTQVADIYLYQFFPNLLPKDYKKRYKFDIEIYNTSGQSRVYMHDRGYHNLLNGKSLSFSEHGFFDHMISVAGIAMKKTKDYIEIYPTDSYDPLVGAINGDFEMSTDGLKDMKDTANVFSTSDAVYDKKYYVQFESISPDEAYVKYKFDHQEANGDYTLVNGDGIKFYSNSIFSDNTEHRELLIQTEEGPYTIEDNKKHTYFYYLKDVKLELSDYKRFEMEVVPTINDIVMVNYPKNIIIAQDGTVNMPVQASCRNLQNATAKWSPSIHNGYYYYNQKEHFLYSKCSYGINGLYVEYLRKNVKIKLIVGELGEDTKDKVFNIAYDSKEDLLLDDYHYSFENNKVWPNPVEVYNDYYMEFANTYEYYSKPFEFGEVPTSITNITWDESGTPISKIDVYAITYDDVYGQWNYPVKIENGKPIPKNLFMSKILRLKFVLTPSRKPKLETKKFLFNCESDWKNNRLKFLSYNIYFLEEVLMPSAEMCQGAFVSKFIDLGDTSDSNKERGIMFNPRYEGEIEFYVQDADSKTSLQETTTFLDWKKVNIGEFKKDLKRFVRYMIVLKPYSKLHSLEFTINRYSYLNMKKEEYLPGFGNIKVQAETKSVDGREIIEHFHYLSTELIYNKEPVIILDNFSDYLERLYESLNIPKDNVCKLEYIPYGSEINFKAENVDNKLIIESLEEIVDEENYDYTDGAKFTLDKTQVATMSPIPQQYAPVILYADEDKEPYNQVFFTNSNGEQTLTNTEEFESLGFSTIYLKYIDIDPFSIVITIDGEKNIDYTITNNIIVFNYKIDAGKKIEISYKISKSFMVDYDYEEDNVIINIYKHGNIANNNTVKSIRVFYETNKLSACRQLSHISFNPIYNTRYNGYIYICDYQDIPQIVEVIPEDDFIFANNKDTMNILVRVLDKNQNPIENIKVNIAAAKGFLKVIDNITDINGIVKCIYTACGENCIDNIKATVTDDAKGSAKIINRKL